MQLRQRFSKLFSQSLSGVYQFMLPRPDSSREITQPSIFVLCGPSGCGKSTLISKLMEDYPGRFGFSVSHTTRQPRGGEINGVHYNFTTSDEMNDQIQKGQFLEHALVHGNHYGTSFSGIQSVSDAGLICILDIDVQGVDKIKENAQIDQTSIVYAMLVPPSIGELEKRLRGRKTDSEEVIMRRVARAREELEYAKKGLEFWDAILVNDSIDICYEKLVELVENRFRLSESSASSKNT